MLPYSSATARLSDRVQLRLANLDEVIERHSSAAITFVLLLYAASAFFASRQTDLFIDEILTYAEAQLPNLHALWWTLKNAPAALDPPLHPLLAFFALRLPLPFPLSIRLPSIIGYGAMMLSIFVFLRRRTPITIALIGAVIPTQIPLFQYAVQARPYALVLGFSGWALVFWQRATEQRSRRIGALIGLYVCITGAILAHYYAGVLFAPLIAGELWRTARQSIDPAIWCAFATAALAMLSYIPFLAAAVPYRAHPWRGVVPQDLGQTYLLGSSPIVVFVLTICSIIWLNRQPTRSIEPPLALPAHEVTAICTLYLVPFFVFDAANLITRTYVDRYTLMFDIAASMSVGILVHSLTRHARGYSSVILALLLSCTALPVIVNLRNPCAQNTGGINKANPVILRRSAGLPIAVTRFNDYGRLYLFGPEELKRRMILVSDRSAITEFGNNVSLANEAVKHALHVPAATSREFLRLHPRFLLIGDYWLRDQAIQNGRQVTFVGKLYHWDLYYVTDPNGNLFPN